MGSHEVLFDKSRGILEDKSAALTVTDGLQD